MKSTKLLRKLLLLTCLGGQNTGLAQEHESLTRLVAFLQKNPTSNLQILLERSRFANVEEFEIFLAENGFEIQSTSDTIKAIETIIQSKASDDANYQEIISFLQERVDIIGPEISKAFMNIESGGSTSRLQRRF